MKVVRVSDFDIPSDENDYDELVAFADTMARIEEFEAIPKADYEARLKADLKAILVELQLEIEELKLDYPIGECEHPAMKIKTTAYRTKTTAEIKHDCAELIQEKINNL